MKLCLNSLGCPDWSAERLLDTALHLGIQAVEIRGLNGKMEAREIEELSESRCAEFCRELKKRGLVFAGFGASSSFHNAQTLSSALDEAKASLDLAKRSGAGFVRVFGNNVPENESEIVVLDRVTGAIRELCDYSDTEVLLEAHGDFNTAKRLKYVCENVDRSNFGIIWDVAHVDRAVGDDIEPFFYEMKEYIRHFHIKDHKRTANGYELCSVGKGDIPIKRIVKLAIDNGYDGYFSFELEKKWHPELPEPEAEFPRFADYMNSIR